MKPLFAKLVFKLINSETHPAKLTAVDLTVAGFLCRLQPMQRMSLGLVLVLFLALWVG